LEPLAERVVLVGLDETACKLRVSRERLALALASPRDRRALARERGTDERGLARELKAGLGRGVDRLERRGQLPTAAALLPSVADQLDVPEAARPLIGLLPDAAVNDLVRTGAVLRRSLAKIDLDTLLAGLKDPGRLEPALRDAVLKGAQEEIRGRVTDRLGKEVEPGVPRWSERASVDLRSPRQASSRNGQRRLDRSRLTGAG
jgi:hypothetical protein